jgi:carbon-monoxide dehydrogenase medium subunit
VKPAPFEYHAPTSLDDAHSLLREYGDDAKVLAGGQSLVPMLALRLTRFDHLVDITGVEDAAGVRDDGDTVRVGTCTRQRTLERDASLADRVPLLAAAVPHIGHFQIRNRGTVGGSLAHADPASELPAVAVALDATFETTDRTIAARDFFVGTWTTDLADDEILVAVHFPRAAPSVRVAVREVARRRGDFALAGAVVQSDPEASTASIGLFGLGPIPLRPTEAEAALAEGAPLDEVVSLAMQITDPTDDIHATAAQRRRIGGAVLGRALADLTNGAPA